MAFTFTIIADYVFDQVLTFTNMNTVKDNQENIKDSYSEEHEFDLGDHDRIAESPNLLWNPTARRGNAGWWDGGDIVNDYNTPGTDVDKAAASYTVPNFVATPGTDAFASGPRWGIIPAAAYKVDLSERIDIQHDQVVTLSFQALIQNIGGAGTPLVGADIVCYDATGKYQGIICQISLGANLSVYTTQEATGTTLANGVGGATADTAYVRIRKWIDDTVTATIYSSRRYKVNKGDTARYYSDEMSEQYLSARYTSQAGFTIPDDALTTINFERGPAGVALPVYTWDDPGADRVTTGANWEFEADRFMKLWVSTRIRTDINVPWRINDFIILYLFADFAGGGFGSYAVLDREDFPVAITKVQQLQGGTSITLNKGDKICIKIHQTSGAARDLKDDSTQNYVDIKEF